MIDQKTYRKNGQENLLVTVALLIALSFLSGYVNIIPSPQQRVTQTELVISPKFKITSPAFSFHKEFHLNKFTTESISINIESSFLYVYNKLTKVKLDNLSQKYDLIKSPINFRTVKTIPKSSKENEFIPFAG